MADEALRELQSRLRKLYAKTGRPSIAPEKLLRALLLQVLYSVRGERMQMEQLDDDLLFQWFVRLNMDDAIWDATSRTCIVKRMYVWLCIVVVFALSSLFARHRRRRPPGVRITFPL